MTISLSGSDFDRLRAVFGKYIKTRNERDVVKAIAAKSRQFLSVEELREFRYLAKTEYPAILPHMRKLARVYRLQNSDYMAEVIENRVIKMDRFIAAYNDITAHKFTLCASTVAYKSRAKFAELEVALGACADRFTEACEAYLMDPVIYEEENKDDYNVADLTARIFTKYMVGHDEFTLRWPDDYDEIAEAAADIREKHLSTALSLTRPEDESSAEFAAWDQVMLLAKYRDKFAAPRKY
jgi:hypothetical protein